MRDGPKAANPNAVELGVMNKWHWRTLGLMGFTGLYVFAVQMKVT